MIRIKVRPSSFKAIESLPKKVAQVVVYANMKLWNDLVEGTPYDTGAAAAYWWPKINGSPPSHPQPPAPASTSGAYARPAPPTVLLESAGKRLTIANAARYIRRLEYEGWSPQAPAGWVRVAAARYRNHIEDGIAQVTG